MIARTTKNRFAYKLDKLFWFALMILPLVIYLVYCYRFSVKMVRFLCLTVTIKALFIIFRIV